LLKTCNVTSAVPNSYSTKFHHSYWQYLYWHHQNGKLFYMFSSQWAIRFWYSVHNITVLQFETTHKKVC
jgi:hypothetical protein